ICTFGPLIVVPPEYVSALPRSTAPVAAPPRVSAPGPPGPSLTVLVKVTPPALLMVSVLYSPETVVGPVKVSDAFAELFTAIAAFFSTTGLASVTALVVLTTPAFRLRFPLPNTALLLMLTVLPSSQVGPV